MSSMICAKPPSATATLNDSWLAGLPCRNSDGESSAASQSASLTRKSGMQPVKRPGCLCWASSKRGLLQCGLCTPEEPAGRQHASHSDIHPAKKHSAQPTTQHPPFNCSSNVSPPSFVPQAPSQLNIVLLNPIDPQGSGSAKQTHTPNKIFLSHTRWALLYPSTKTALKA